VETSDVTRSKPCHVHAAIPITFLAQTCLVVSVLRTHSWVIFPCRH